MLICKEIAWGTIWGTKKHLFILFVSNIKDISLRKYQLSKSMFLGWSIYRETCQAGTGRCLASSVKSGIQ